MKFNPQIIFATFLMYIASVLTVLSKDYVYPCDSAKDVFTCDNTLKQYCQWKGKGCVNKGGAAPKAGGVLNNDLKTIGNIARKVSKIAKIISHKRRY